MAKNRTINNMAAEEAAYGKKLTTGKVATVAFPYVALFTGLALFMYWSLIPGVIVLILSSIIAYYSIAKRTFDARYYRRAANQRHQFISMVTQIFGNGKNKNMTVLKALQMANKDQWGEFKQDIEKLISVISENGHNNETHKAFEKLRGKYSDDPWFVNFTEQLETANESGIANTDSFHDTLFHSNQLFDEMRTYINQRNHCKNEVYGLGVAILIACYLLANMFGIGNFVRMYAHSIFGWVVSTLFIIGMFFIFRKMYQYYFDESLTSVK